jgi:hypothetical protein
VFEQLIKHPRVLARHRQSPLAEERLRYLVHCAGLGMARSTLLRIATFLLDITDSLRLAQRPGELITPAEIQVQAARWAQRLQPNKQTRQRCLFLAYATRWLQFLGRWQPPLPVPRRFADRVAAFADSMHRDRGLSCCTISFRCRLVQDLLDRLCVCLPLEEITPGHIDAVLIDKLNQGRWARTSVQTYACALRSFFRFAQAQGWCRSGLAEAIKAPRVFSQQTLPCGPCCWPSSRGARALLVTRPWTAGAESR